MLPILVVCLLFLQSSSVTCYGANAQQRLWAGQNMYPGAMVPMMQPEGLGHYERYVPYQPSQLPWGNMRMPMPFYHIPGCDIPSHQNMHMMRSPFINENQLTGTPFQDLGQWQQVEFQNGIQGQWNQPAIKDQWKQTQIPNKVNDQWQQPFPHTKGNNQFNQAVFENQGNSQWKQASFNNNQGGWNQQNFRNQGQDQWQQANNWNLDPNVKMIGQWDAFPANDQMLRQPAVADLARTRTATRFDTVKPVQPGPQTFGFEKLDAPVQSRGQR
ncbi:uncharacterized protein LOC132742482 [Ruditapes philippinarum]|uniref:uncharacterized protein LOC132742482 n=1 Tax=Ruditapes philippinarum TaxID=129788 RepID=UPI00295AC720|nr:uncharacterized protein LOC132742482 [Ruditapes philippinarum]XP_060586904.1 uncharacterized protein LOC132742482 [Ruditapes philippinarum]